MEADGAEDARGAQLLKGSRERPVDGPKLIVDRDSDSLKGTGRRMDAGREPVPGGDGFADHRRKGRRAAEDARSACRHEGPDDPAPMGFLAEVANGPDEHLLRRRFKPLGRGNTAPR